MKKFINFFNIFELDLTRKSYKSPVIRIIASLLVMFAVCAIRLNITIPNVPLNFIITFAMIGVIMLAILCFFIASVECLQVGHNQKIEKARQEEYGKYK